MKDRFDELEIRLAYFECHATEQDKVMLELSRDLDRLKKEFAILRARAAADREAAAGESPGSDDERPPHY